MENIKQKFSKIYDQNIEKIYRFIILKVNSNEIAQDLTSETFLKTWRSFESTNGNIDNPKAFLYKTARNLIIDHYREKGRTQVVSAEEMSIPDPRPSLEDRAMDNFEVERVKLAMHDLREEYQNILVMHYLNDLSISEIAKSLDKSNGATRVLLHRALKSLKGRVEEV